MPWPPCDSPLPVLQFCSAAAKHDHNMGLFASAAGALLLQPCMADPRSTSCSPAVSIWCYILYNWPQTSCKTILYKTLRGGNACHNNDDISQVMALNNCFSTLWSHLSTSYALSFFLVLFVGHVVHEEICSLCIKHIFLLSKAHSVLLYSFCFGINTDTHTHLMTPASEVMNSQALLRPFLSVHFYVVPAFMQSYWQKKVGQWKILSITLKVSHCLTVHQHWWAIPKLVVKYYLQ